MRNAKTYLYLTITPLILNLLKSRKLTVGSDLGLGAKSRAISIRFPQFLG